MRELVVPVRLRLRGPSVGAHVRASAPCCMRLTPRSCLLFSGRAFPAPADLSELALPSFR